jgi:peptide deformylase
MPAVPVDPASLMIQTYPAPILRQRASEVSDFTPELRAVAQRMIELMFEAEGIGLAAPQVGLPLRLFVAHVPPSGPGKDGEPARSAESTPPTATIQPTVYVNPVLTGPGGELVPYEEGCLSLPDIRGDVNRPELITIAARDLEGQSFTQRGAGLLARCWQHEFDHLEGILIIDRMTQVSRIKTRAALRKLEREHRL